jgi:hypothetical protein
MIDKATKEAKLRQIANDRVMLQSFMELAHEVFEEKSADRDVNNLASRFLSIELLNKVEMRLENYRDLKPEDNQILKQPGL